MLLFDQLRSKDAPIKISVLFILFCFLLLAAKLWKLQVSSTTSFQSRQENQSLRAIRLPAIRGKILDRNNKPLAVNRLRFDIHVYIDELRLLFREHYFRLKRNRKDQMRFRRSFLFRFGFRRVFILEGAIHPYHGASGSFACFNDLAL